ncbi:glycosyltransferase family 2 protein [Paenibacillus sp. PsM32]|uniref:glycosyltransferase family 2 protein n=1 Tax=Paenibacillus sp. PsM32 TaxID=3030536 RepID=UPI00263B068D|nr:glycosyltransferase family 2 protein [Paenibacillus sp. PsM32]MDN4620948.1 glycosyltransferase family 2 protein [Paenibacillus sp. PsM32]
MKLLSLCMIVKNEEDILERCLNSVKDIVDEIIIVDTGSTDRTRQIAQNYQAKIIDFEWINDFAAAKNKAIEQATGKWILMLDADEYMTENDTTNLRAFLEKQEPQPNIAFNISIINYTGKKNSGNIMESSADRIFPNHMDIWYERPIHEQLFSKKPDTDLRNFQIPFRIHHSGYLHEVLAKKNKHERNMQIFNEYKKNNTFQAYDFFTLGNEYHAIENYPEAILNYKKSIEQAESSKVAWYPHALIGLINTYYHLNQLDKSWEMIENKLVEFNDYPEYYTLQGIHYEWFGYFVKAEEAYKNAIRVAEKKAKIQSTFWLYSPSMGFNIPLERLANISVRFARPQDNISWLTKLLAHNKQNVSLLILILEQISAIETSDQLIHYFSGIYDLNEVRDVVLLFEACLAVGNIELAEHYRDQVHIHYEVSLEKKLRIALLKNDVDTSKHLLQQIMLPDRSINNYNSLIIAALILQDTDVLQDLASIDGTTGSIARWSLQLLQKKLLPESIALDDYHHTLFLIAKEIFFLHQFELYDEFVEYFNHSKLINDLANYFYTRNYMDIAIQYYSLLLPKNELAIQSLENLGYFHTNASLPEEAVSFFKEALRIDPSHIYVYPTLIKQVPIQEKQLYTDQFQQRLTKLNLATVAFTHQQDLI